MSTNDKTAQRKAVVVGAGPVGCLAALAMAKMGWAVEVYEGRPDIRLPASKENVALRSINLAISARGIAALRAIDTAATDRFLDTVIPMKGRMIHDTQGRQNSQLYDRNGQCINSVDRGLLNEGLLDEVAAIPLIRVFFEHKLTTADFDKRLMTFHDSGNTRDVHVSFDFCIGADGSYSNVRRQLMRCVRMDFQQTYIPHEYMELRMPPARDTQGNATFALDPNHLHIWPRHSFMLIALPNKDKSFTCTLFAPTVDFAQIEDPYNALSWFRQHFPDALLHIGEHSVLEAFRQNPRSPLIVIKANPYHYKDRAVILGDAAHSMVPFYGQGLNCGLEDVRVLDVILRGEGVDPSSTAGLYARQDGDLIDPRLERALQRYSESRHEDLVAISDLAMANYLADGINSSTSRGGPISNSVEMRHAVATPAYLFLRALDNVFSSLTPRWQTVPASVGPLLSRVPFPSTAPGGWIPLYTMVTFRPDISYSTAKRKAEKQSRVVAGLGWCGTALGMLGIGIASMRIWQCAKHMK